MKIPLLVQDQRIRSWAITAAIAAFVSVLCWGAVVLWQPDNNYPQPQDPTARSLQKINSILKVWEQAGYPVGATFSGTTETNINVSALGGMLLNTNPFPVQLRDASGNVASINTSSNMNLGTWGPGATNFDATHGVPVVLAGNTNNNVVYVGNAVIGDTAANPAFVQAKTSTNQIHDAAGRLLSLNDEGSMPVTLPAASHVTVTPETTTSAVADGQALSYNAVVTVPRTNSYLTQVIVSDTETNVPASMNLKAFDLIIYSDAVTAQTPASAHAVTPAEMAKTLAIYSVTTGMWQTNRAVNTYSGGGVVHCPGFARMTNSVNGNILCIPAGTQLTFSLKARATYTPQATNTIQVGFDFLPMK